MFKANKYKNAVMSYSQALKENIDDDKELLSILHANRAASHFYLKNFRSALNDCVFSRKCNPKNIKPIYKGAECCFELKLFDDAIKWCEMGFKLNENDSKLKDIKTKSELAKVSQTFFVILNKTNNYIETQKSFERDTRKNEAMKRKKNDDLLKIYQKIKVDII